jgi:hypothetical protein
MQLLFRVEIHFGGGQKPTTIFGRRVINHKPVVFNHGINLSLPVFFG